MDSVQIRNLVPFLRKDNLDKHQAMKALEKENHALKRQLKEKDDEIQHLQGNSHILSSFSISFQFLYPQGHWLNPRNNMRSILFMQ